MAARPHVGTLGEKPLHASLKRWYSEPGDQIEEPVDGFVIDLVRGTTLIEIQTGGFSSMRRKLPRLLDSHRVRLVHPIAVEKWIVKVSEDGEIVSRRRSPKRGAVTDVFSQLVSFPELVDHPGLTIELVLTSQEELQRFDGKKGWRRKGWVVEERRLIEVLDLVPIDNPTALGALLPEGLPEEFTTADLAGALRRPRRLAQQMTYCLKQLDLIETAGKQGNAIVYTRS